jgi:hypothetical protein
MEAGLGCGLRQGYGVSGSAGGSLPASRSSRASVSRMRSTSGHPPSDLLDEQRHAFGIRLHDGEQFHALSGLPRLVDADHAEADDARGNRLRGHVDDSVALRCRGHSCVTS